jgi:hypothetical protein
MVPAREVWRRVRNFFVGPSLRVLCFRTPWIFQVVPAFSLFRWYSSKGYHFTRVAIIEIIVWDLVVGLYWVDNDPIV